MTRRLLTDDRVMALLLGAVALLLYLRTLAPSIVLGDSPELATAAYELGVPHPPGYPLYTLLGHAAIVLVPWGDPAHRMNLLSAFAGSAAVAMTYFLSRRMMGRIAAAISTLLVATSFAFWSQAIVTEVYTLHVLLVASVLLALLRWDSTGSRRALLTAAFLYGLTFTHHLTTVCLAPGILLFVASSRRRREALAASGWIVLCFCAPLAIYLYLPWAAWRDPNYNWGDPRTLDRFLIHVTGRYFRSDLRWHSPAYQWRRIWHDWGTIVPLPTWLLPFLAVGAVDLLRRRARTAALFAFYAATVLLFTANYSIPDIEEYYIPVHLLEAVLIGCGLHRAAVEIRRRSRSGAVRMRTRRVLGTAGTALLACLGIMAAGTVPSVDLSSAGPLLPRGGPLTTLAPSSLLIIRGALYFPTLYRHEVDHLRPDVVLLYGEDLVYRPDLRLVTRLRKRGILVTVPACYARSTRLVHPDDCFLEQIIRENAPERPVYCCGYADDDLRKAVPSVRWEPGGQPVLYRALPFAPGAR